MAANGGDGESNPTFTPDVIAGGDSSFYYSPSNPRFPFGDYNSEPAFSLNSSLLDNPSTYQHEERTGLTGDWNGLQGDGFRYNDWLQANPWIHQTGGSSTQVQGPSDTEPTDTTFHFLRGSSLNDSVVGSRLSDNRPSSVSNDDENAFPFFYGNKVNVPETSPEPSQRKGFEESSSFAHNTKPWNTENTDNAFPFFYGSNVGVSTEPRYTKGIIGSGGESQQPRSKPSVKPKYSDIAKAKGTSEPLIGKPAKLLSPAESKPPSIKKAAQLPTHVKQQTNPVSEVMAGTTSKYGLDDFETPPVFAKRFDKISPEYGLDPLGDVTKPKYSKERKKSRGDGNKSAKLEPTSFSEAGFSAVQASDLGACGGHMVESDGKTEESHINISSGNSKFELHGDRVSGNPMNSARSTAVGSKGTAPAGSSTTSGTEHSSTSSWFDPRKIFDSNRGKKVKAPEVSAPQQLEEMTSSKKTGKLKKRKKLASDGGDGSHVAAAMDTIPGSGIGGMEDGHTTVLNNSDKSRTQCSQLGHGQRKPDYINNLQPSQPKMTNTDRDRAPHPNIDRDRASHPNSGREQVPYTSTGNGQSGHSNAGNSQPGSRSHHRNTDRDQPSHRRRRNRPPRRAVDSQETGRSGSGSFTLPPWAETILGITVHVLGSTCSRIYTVIQEVMPVIQLILEVTKNLVCAALQFIFKAALLLVFVIFGLCLRLFEWLENVFRRVGVWVAQKLGFSGTFFEKKSKQSGPPRSFQQTQGPIQVGLEENIALPATCEEAMKRLLSIQGSDAFCILGLRSDASDADVKRYYRKQAVLVHPDKNKSAGAEEAFKILGHAFELIGTPENRQDYMTKLREERHSEAVKNDLVDLLEHLNQTMAEAANRVNCVICGSIHRRYPTDKEVLRCRYCSQCKDYHSAKEGDVWVETTVMGFSWHFYSCMGGKVYEITEWVKCQKDIVDSIKPNDHTVRFRMDNTRSGSRGQGSHRGPHQRAQQGRPSAGGECPPDLEELLRNMFPQQAGAGPGAPPTSGAADRPQGKQSRVNKKKRRKAK